MKDIVLPNPASHSDGPGYGAAAGDVTRPRTEAGHLLAARRLLLQDESRDAELTIEWHDVDVSDSARFVPIPCGILQLCLNLVGRGAVHFTGRRMDLEPATAAFYLCGRRAVQHQRHPGERHRFLTVSLSRGFLRNHLSDCDGALHPLVEKALLGKSFASAPGEIHHLTTEQTHRATQWIYPPVPQTARPLWYQARVLELMTEFLFERPAADELFCDRQKRLARERVGQVIAILRRHLAAPPNLAQIGRQVGCSPFHLSRTFSREMGMTIPQYTRKLRMERAAELLREGKCNVTEAALEVGYSSLSHFSQAFCQTTGCCPCLYPLKRQASS